MSQSSVHRIARPIMVCLVGAMIMLFSASPNGSTLFFTWPWVFYGQILLLVPIFLLGGELVKGRCVWRNDWWPLGVMAVAIVVSVLLSQRPASSFEAALFLLSGLAWCGWVAHRIATDSGTRGGSFRVVPAARLAGLALAVPLLAGLSYWIADWLRGTVLDGNWFHAVRSLFSWRNQYPFGHWNYTGGFALLALPWFGALVLIERGRWRLVWMSCVLVGVVMLISSSSRGAVLGVLTALAVGFGAAVFAKKVSREKTALAVLAGLALAVGLFATNSRLRSIATAPASVFLPSEGDVQRIAMLQGGKLLAAQHPWVGHGPGMTPFLYPAIRAQLVGGIETSFQLHNGPLQLLVDHGWFGLICALAIGLVAAKNALRWLRSPAGVPRTFALASAFSLVGYFVMFVTDYQLNVLAFAAAIGLQAGVLLGAPLADQNPGLPIRRWPGATLLLAGVAAAVFLIPGWRAREVYWSAWETNQPNEMLARLERTVAISPRNPYYLNQLALRRARLAESADSAIASGLRAQSRMELSHSLELDSAQEPVHAALGWLWLSDQPKQAEQHFRAALRLLPDRDTVHFGLALAKLAQDDRPGGIRELALECMVNPLFLASPLWTQDPFHSLRPEVIEKLFDDYDFAIQRRNTPSWSRAQLLYASAFARWWQGGQPPDSTVLKGALPWQKEFFERLVARDGAQLVSGHYGWSMLERARQDAAHAEAILRSAGSPFSNEAIAGALARLAAKPVDLSQLLRSTAPNGVGILRREITRGHYAIMNNVLDGPGYEDLAPRLYDAFILEYVGALFPAHYAIPGSVVIELMEKP